MKRIWSAIGLGVLVAAAVISFAFFVSGDLRWIYLLGAFCLFASGVYFGRSDRARWAAGAALCAPLIAIFSFFVFTARNIPLRTGDTILYTVLWCGCACAGFAWRVSKRPALVVTLLLAGFSGWFTYRYLPFAAADARNQFQSVPAPEFVLQTPEGATIPADAFHEKVVVLDFFSTTCPPCLAELPHLEQVRKELADQDRIQMYLVASEVAGDTPDMIRSYLKENNIGIQVAFDREGKAHQAFGFIGVPALIVLDGSGKIRLSREGFNRAESEALRANLLALLNSLS